MILADISDYQHFLENRIIAPAVLLVITGSIVFIIAFLGCYGALKEHYYMLIAVSWHYVIIHICKSIDFCQLFFEGQIFIYFFFFQYIIYGQ